MATADEIRARKRAWAKANPDQERSRKRAWAKANPEKVKASKRAWAKANPEKLRPGKRAWEHENPEVRERWLFRSKYGFEPPQELIETRVALARLRRAIRAAIQ